MTLKKILTSIFSRLTGNAPLRVHAGIFDGKRLQLYVEIFGEMLSKGSAKLMFLDGNKLVATVRPEKNPAGKKGSLFFRKELSELPVQESDTSYWNLFLEIAGKSRSLTLEETIIKETPVLRMPPDNFNFVQYRFGLGRKGTLRLEKRSVPPGVYLSLVHTGPSELILQTVLTNIPSRRPVSLLAKPRGGGAPGVFTDAIYLPSQELIEHDKAESVTWKIPITKMAIQATDHDLPSPVVWDLEVHVDSESYKITKYLYDLKSPRATYRYSTLIDTQTEYRDRFRPFWTLRGAMAIKHIFLTEQIPTKDEK
jgi:hypothetical protein